MVVMDVFCPHFWNSYSTGKMLNSACRIGSKENLELYGVEPASFLSATIADEDIPEVQLISCSESFVHNN